MRRLPYGLCLAATMLSLPATAEEFLGEQAPHHDAAVGERPAAPASVKESRLRADAASSHQEFGDWRFGGGLGAGSGFVDARAVVGFVLHKYISADTTYAYRRQDDGPFKSERYGPQVDLVARFVNPTIVTPFVSAGPGYVKWQRQEADVSADAGSSWIANAAGGAEVRLTRHFGIQVARHQLTYLQLPPRLLENSERRQERTQLATNIGFQVIF